MWKLFRKPAPADPEVFETTTEANKPSGLWLDDHLEVDTKLQEIETKQRNRELSVLLAASCADSSEPVEKFLQLYDRAQKYLEALDKRA